jgi:hypothetical protein
LAEIFTNWPNFIQIGAEKTNHGSNFDQLGRYSTKIGGGNSTARGRPFLNEFRPKNNFSKKSSSSQLFVQDDNHPHQMKFIYTGQ